MRKNRVIVCALGRSTASYRKKIAETMLKTLRLLQKEGAVLYIYLVEEKTMAELNAEYRGKKKPATVLAFPEPRGFPHPETGNNKTVLGEIYIAPGYIRRKKESWQYLLIHGLLHLLGYTHQERHGTMEMEKKEKEIMNRVW